MRISFSRLFQWKKGTAGITLQFTPGFVLVIILSLSFFSCHPAAEFKEYYEPPEAVWTYADTLRFTPEIQDTTLRYDVVLDLEHARSYAFENLYFRVRHSRILDEQIQIMVDTFNTNILGNDGLFTGNCRGDHCRFRTVLYPQYQFDQTGPQPFVFEQFTRTDSLQGIRRIGLILEKSMD